MTKIALFHLSAPTLGGRVSYTYYLAQSLRSQGLEPEIYEVKSKNETSLRRFAGEWPYRNITLANAVQIVRSTPSLITAMDKNFSEIGRELLTKKAGLVLHKPEKLTRRVIGILKGCGNPVIAPSQLLADQLLKLGIDAACIPYPYPYDVLPARPRPLSSVSLGRIERNRWFDRIFRVNQCLRDSGLSGRIIQIYGDENRVFAFKEVAPTVPDWRSLGYIGTFEAGTGSSVAADAELVIDLKDERSGVVGYPIIEAWAGGATPMIREERYLTLCRYDSDPDFREAFAICPGDEKAFAKRIAEGPTPSLSEETRKKLLFKHLPSSVIPAYIEALRIK